MTVEKSHTPKDEKTINGTSSTASTGTTGDQTLTSSNGSSWSSTSNTTSDSSNYIFANVADEKDITRSVKLGDFILERKFSLTSNAKTLQAEDIVKLDDIWIMDFVVYDSRSGITEKTNAQVAEGIKRLIGKNVQFRHIDIKEDPFSMLGEALGGYKILDKIDRKTNAPYMQIEFPLKLDAITAEHVEMIQVLVDIQKRHTDEDDYESRVGCSLGWVETAEKFLPYEVSITPIPRCNECRGVGQSCELLSSTAEKETDSMKEEQAEHDAKDCDKKGCAECKKAKSDNAESSLLNAKESVVIDLNVENRQLKAQVAELSGKLIADAKNHDEALVSLTAEKKVLTDKVAVFETEIALAKTLPIRTEIAEKLMGLEGEQATAKVEALSSMTAETLTEFHNDLKVVASNNNNSNYESPIVAAAGGSSPSSVKGMTAEEEAKEWMKEAGLGYGDKDKSPNMW